MLSIGLAITLTVISIVGVWFISYGSQSNSNGSDRKSLYRIEKMEYEFYDNQTRQKELVQKVQELEVRNRNLEDYLKSLKESFDTSHELLEQTRIQVKELQEAKNAPVVEQ